MEPSQIFGHVAAALGLVSVIELGLAFLFRAERLAAGDD